MLVKEVHGMTTRFENNQQRGFRRPRTFAVATPVFATHASRCMGSCIIGNSASRISAFWK